MRRLLAAITNKRDYALVPVAFRYKLRHSSTLIGIGGDLPGYPISLIGPGRREAATRPNKQRSTVIPLSRFMTEFFRFWIWHWHKWRGYRVR